jgi:hypothetical protein
MRSNQKTKASHCFNVRVIVFQLLEQSCLDSFSTEAGRRVRRVERDDDDGSMAKVMTVSVRSFSGALDRVRRFFQLHCHGTSVWQRLCGFVLCQVIRLCSVPGHRRHVWLLGKLPAFLCSFYL